MNSLHELRMLAWAHPWLLLIALQPLLMSALLGLRRQRLLHYADAHLRPWAMQDSGKLKTSRWQAVLHALAWLLLACALAGPRLPLIAPLQQGNPRHELDIMVLLDVSASMLAKDIAPQRLQRAKLELLDLLPKLQGERLGLLAFAGSPGLLMPLNRDMAAFRYYLDMAQPALFTAQGTALANALELAQRNMPAAPAARAILLVSDAESSVLSGPAGAAVWEAAAKLKQEGIPLFILGVGSEQGATITLPDGNTLVSEGADVISMQDVAGFTQLARQTGGRFVQVADGDADWAELYEKGLKVLPGGVPGVEQIQAWQELYGYFLLPAILLLAWLHFGRVFAPLKKLFVVLYVGVLVAGGNAHEAEAAEQDAYAAYQQQDYARAQMLYGDLPGYAARLGEGAAAYRRKDYHHAINQFTKALLQSRDDLQREPALYNLGNSYFMAGNFRAAADAFIGVLKITAGNQDARANLALSAGKLAELNKPVRPANGIPGRRGRDLGGALGEDAANAPLSIEQEDEQNSKLPGMGSKIRNAERARLAGPAAGSGLAGGEADREMRYRAAQKKLELTEDMPAVMLQSLLRIEAARDYVPQQEMAPW